ncbi:MAG: extracellular solute-binding protein [Candidatus Pristimantibacillus lignocellulolyticus]|uniref:Extracellular solute-binding protein n=1 Tax=Candidatus Pristimantibacillus lignocellulolyticus TaxID=2994561 RepID=A0A9J6Z944_9BACL|nr:MAG: extracellular solute-binding protein [Candidatus Pristimantibacillus lignocellulolyticus]
MKNKKTNWAMLLLVCTMLFLAACSNNGGTSTNNGDKNAAPTPTPAESTTKDPEPEQITLKFFTALADRANGLGKVEQDIIDQYMVEFPNVKIEVEALQDEPYKAKVKVYSSTNDLPDIMQVWGQPSFIQPLLDNNLLASLDESSFKDLDFVEGSFDGFAKDGKIYGVPRGADYLVLYYNKKMFADNNLTAPTTTEELNNVIATFRGKNINPIAINGMDGWTLPIWYDYVLQRQTGTFDTMDQGLRGEKSFTDEEFVKGAQAMLDFANAKGFADGYLTADYGAARNLFGQEQSAMYLMGNWEASLATDENFSEDFRNNVAAVPYPASDVAPASNLASWYGGGYSIAENSKHKEEASKFLNYMFQPDRWAKMIWEADAGTPAQKFEQFLTGNETALQKELVQIFNTATSSSGTPIHDSATDEFKQTVMDAHQSLLVGKITPVQFAQALEDAASKTR